jgi:hypothetical protein
VSALVGRQGATLGACRLARSEDQTLILDLLDCLDALDSCWTVIAGPAASPSQKDAG